MFDEMFDDKEQVQLDGDVSSIEHIKDAREILKLFHGGNRITIGIYLNGEWIDADITEMTMVSDELIIFNWKTKEGIEGQGTMNKGASNAN